MYLQSSRDVIADISDGASGVFRQIGVVGFDPLNGALGIGAIGVTNQSNERVFLHRAISQNGHRRWTESDSKKNYEMDPPLHDI